MRTTFWGGGQLGLFLAFASAFRAQVRLISTHAVALPTLALGLLRGSDRRRLEREPIDVVVVIGNRSMRRRDREQVGVVVIGNRWMSWS